MGTTRRPYRNALQSERQLEPGRADGPASTQTRLGQIRVHAEDHADAIGAGNSRDTMKGTSCRSAGPSEANLRRPGCHAEDRITDTLDEIVTDNWRTPDDYRKLLPGAPNSELPTGQFRLGAECNREDAILVTS